MTRATPTLFVQEDTMRIPRTTPRLIAACAVGIVVAGCPVPSSAQVLFGEPHDVLNAADFDRMHAAATHLYEHRSPGAVERWSGDGRAAAGLSDLGHAVLPPAV